MTTLLNMSLQSLSKPTNRWLLGLLVTATAFTGVTAFYVLSKTPQSTSQPLVTAPAIPKVTALGRLEPEAEVIRLFAPLDLDGDRVAQLLVKEGDRVKTGQAIAILDSRDRLQDTLNQAQEQVQEEWLR